MVRSKSSKWAVWAYNYLQQLGNTVEGNLKFKENKTVITPADQRHQFNESIRQKLYELHDKGKEQEYYLEIDKPGNDNSQSDKTDAMKDFHLTWSDASQIEQTTDDKNMQTGIEQDFRLEWDNSPAAENDNYTQDIPSTNMTESSDRIQKMKDFKLTFDTMGQEEHQIDNKDMGAERDDKDLEYDDD